MNGKVDKSFGNGGYVDSTFGGYAMTMQADGKIVTVGNYSGKFFAARFLNDVKKNLNAGNASAISTLATSNVQIFPNPVKDILHVTGINSAHAGISIFNNEGKLILQPVTVNETCNLNVKALHAGVYYLHIEENISPAENKKIINIKFMKE